MNELLFFWVFIIYIFLMVIFIYITILSKRLANIKNSFFLLQLIENNWIDNKQKVCLFISFSNKDNIKIINEFTERYENSDIFLFYKGPEWQKNSITKKINTNIKIILDEKGYISEYFNIYEYPSWILLDETQSIKYKGKFFV